MGDPMTYLTIEPADGAEDLVREALDAWRGDWSSVVRRGGALGARRHGRDPESARAVLEDLDAAVARALVLAVTDATAVGAGEGRLFARAGDDLVRVETVSGGECGGGDVVDYVRRHYEFEEVGRRA